MKVRLATAQDADKWDDYASLHSTGSPYHLFAWKIIIESAYDHAGYYLLAEKGNTIAGILPLFHMKHFLSGNRLVSLPFLDFAGPLADSRQVESLLVLEAMTLKKNIGADGLELRTNCPLDLKDMKRLTYRHFNHKVRMLLKLPESPDALMASFRSKLRSQIRKPIKDGLSANVGKIDLLNDFYDIFLVNMRDLGSPVHSKKLFVQILKEIEQSHICIVRKDGVAMAASFVIGHRNTLANPWASSLRRYSGFNPNMLLYWKMLEFASDQGYDFFDFGRSSPGGGTYRFKAQWGALPSPLNWYVVPLGNEKNVEKNVNDKDSDRMKLAVKCWQKLPVSATRILGPVIRKHISL